MNFAMILFVLLVITGAVVILDRVRFAKRRGEGEKEPWWIEYPKSFFPVILIVFLLRSFLVEPFQIPSESMVPTLITGDFILVNKYTYGVRLPILNAKIMEVNSPQRGDVMVFRYPNNPSQDYIKRVVGLPGDKITYQDKRLWINGQEVPLKPDSKHAILDGQGVAQQFVETLGRREHVIRMVEGARGVTPGVNQFPFRGNCTYNNESMTCTVPPDHYFVMGDNRDNSSDSRVWGFVPDANIVGKAFIIWFNFGEPRRIGTRL